jgi:hypothetical protein
VSAHTATLINLTPHPIAIYPLDTPDQICPGSVTPIRTLQPSLDHGPVRLLQLDQGAEAINAGVPVHRVRFGGTDQADPLPSPVPGVYLVVSLVVGLAASHRDDVLVIAEAVRDRQGCVIGARALARPVRDH